MWKLINIPKPFNRLYDVGCKCGVMKRCADYTQPSKSGITKNEVV